MPFLIAITKRSVGGSGFSGKMKLVDLAIRQAKLNKEKNYREFYHVKIHYVKTIQENVFLVLIILHSEIFVMKCVQNFVIQTKLKLYA